MRKLLFECYDRTFEGMTDSEWRVFCAICKHANDETGGDCFPGTLLLAKESRLHKNTVPPQIKSLEEKKWIRTEQESGKRRYFFVDVGRILSCPRIGSNDSVPLQEPVPLNNSVPLQEPVADGYRKIEGTGTESCTRREQLREQEKTNLQTVDDSPFSLEPDQSQAANEVPAENTTSNTADTAVCTVKHPAETKKPAKRKAITHLFELEAIPDEWRELCEQIRPDLDPQRVFVEFRFYWTQGKGQGTRRSDKGWTSTWMNWIKRQKEQRVAQTNGKAPLPPHKDPAFHFGKEYYDKSVNPDGTTNWGV